MKCEKCGFQQSEKTRFCGNCGAFLSPDSSSIPNQTTSPSPLLPDSRILEANKKANTAKILGIVGLFVAGIILGILAISQASSAKKELESLGQPTGVTQAGFVLGILDIVLAVFALAIIYPML